jgi:hypothetical protein
MTETYENLKKRIMILNEKVWEGRVSWPQVELWLNNFTGRIADRDAEQLHALFWLSQFMYFGSKEIRVLLKSLYRDLYLCPMIQDVLNILPPNSTEADLKIAIRNELTHTRFLGVGNPSESGVHLLYYFRQENELSKENFLDSVQIFTKSIDSQSDIDIQGSDSSSHLKLKNPDLRRYVFIDDICGSGDTAIDYSKEILNDLLRLNPNAKVAYYCLFATKKGLDKVRNKSLFRKNCEAVYELDPSYRCLSNESRYLKGAIPIDINPILARKIVEEYGQLLDPEYACGYKDSQMLMGFHHNTPNNTLGIMWHDSAFGGSSQWYPIFKRYPKVYGELL